MKYKHINTSESTHNVAKPNPENCKNCSSKCAYDCAQLQFTIQHTAVLIILPPDNHHNVCVWCFCTCQVFFSSVRSGSSCQIYFMTLNRPGLHNWWLQLT